MPLPRKKTPKNLTSLAQNSTFANVIRNTQEKQTFNQI